jgi:hypothetical protein
LEGYGLEGIATQVFFIEVDDANICEYDGARAQLQKTIN